MGFNVSALPDYVDQTSEKLISRPHFENTSGQYFSVSNRNQIFGRDSIV